LNSKLTILYKFSNQIKLQKFIIFTKTFGVFAFAVKVIKFNTSLAAY